MHRLGSIPPDAFPPGVTASDLKPTPDGALLVAEGRLEEAAAALHREFGVDVESLPADHAHVCASPAASDVSASYCVSISSENRRRSPRRGRS